jgi:hypothetical protein
MKAALYSTMIVILFVVASLLLARGIELNQQTENRIAQAMSVLEQR